MFLGCSSGNTQLTQVFAASPLQALKSLFTSRSTGIGRKGRWLTAEDLEAYLYAMSQPGALTGALNYYRNVFRWGSLHSPKDKMDSQVKAQKYSVQNTLRPKGF